MPAPPPELKHIHFQRLDFGRQFDEKGRESRPLPVGLTPIKSETSAPNSEENLDERKRPVLEPMEREGKAALLSPQDDLDLYEQRREIELKLRRIELERISREEEQAKVLSTEETFEMELVRIDAEERLGRLSSEEALDMRVRVGLEMETIGRMHRKRLRAFYAILAATIVVLVLLLLKFIGR